MAVSPTPDQHDDPPDPTSRDVEGLYREHNETLLRFLRARLNNEADAREAAQEAYVRLLQLDKPDQPSFLRAYLFRIAANVATDVLRRRRVRGPDIGTDDCAVSEPALQERAVSATQQLDIVGAALKELPPNCREAFVLSRRDAVSTSDIAKLLGVSDRMVRIYLVRALEHIQNALRAGDEGRASR
jgi:RNA polymerase sigma factor (sigma-70 family)